jgi:hypothetical protein
MVWNWIWIWIWIWNWISPSLPGCLAVINIRTSKKESKSQSMLPVLPVLPAFPGLMVAASVSCF